MRQPGDWPLGERLTQRLAELETECRELRQTIAKIRELLEIRLRESKTAWRRRHAALHELAIELAEILKLTPAEQTAIAVTTEQHTKSIFARTADFTADILHRTASGAKYLARWRRKHAKKQPPKDSTGGSSQ